jgi:hypothetical protein
MKNRFLMIPAFLMIFGLSSQAMGQAEIGAFLSPDVPIGSIPKDLKLPDAILPYLASEFNNTLGKQGSFDMQFKIVFLATRITNIPSAKYDFLQNVVETDIKGGNTSSKLLIVSPDARVIAIEDIGLSSNSLYIPVLLDVVERDNVLQTRIAAAKILPSLGNSGMIVPKLVDLLKNQYGSGRGKFSEADEKRYNDDRVAQALIETLGDLGDPRAFSVLLRTVMSPETHRDETIKAAWDSMKKLKW